MPYHRLDFTPPRPQIAAAPVANYSTAAHSCRAAGEGFALNRLFDIYSLRIGGFQKDAPPSDWNGVFALDSK